MNIYQKLIEVRKSCEYLKKDNKGHQFNFVSSSQTLGTLRKAMDDNSLLLVPSVESYEIRDHTTKNGGHEYFTALAMTFTWVNAEKPDETIACKWTGQGLDSGEKGVGKALTYAEKYFLLKFFNIATDKDDPDSRQTNDEPKQQTQQNNNQSDDKPWYNTLREDTPTMLARLDSGEHKNTQEIIDQLSEGFKISNKDKAAILALKP